MALSREEIANIIRDRLVRKVQQEFTFNDIAQAVAQSTANEKRALIDGVRRNNAKGIGEAILAPVLRKAADDAASEAETILEDDVLDLTELERIL